MKENEHNYPKKIKEVVINGESLTIEQVVAVARSTSIKVKLSPKCIKKIQASRNWVEKVVETGEPIVYGLNTGFGSKNSVHIQPKETEELQRSLIVSHSAGVGEPFEEEIVRATMLLRANTLAKGYSGVRIKIIENLLRMLNGGVHPIIPSQGSVGASGDLAPLSHLALVLSRDKEDKEEESGEAIYKGKRMSGKEAMKQAGIDRVILSAKEGLALNNGCQVSSAIACLALFDAENLFKNAQISVAMSLEALKGRSDAFNEKIHNVRPYIGQVEVAKNILELVKGSELIDSKINSNSKKVQDAYSLRCVPQVHGAVYDTIQFVKQILSIEINSATDNPLIFTDAERPNKAFSGGNFHGEYIAFAMDFLAIAVAVLGSIAERRIYKLTNRFLNENLPPFLSEDNRWYSGFMIPQCTAASLVSENKVMAHPASVDSIPTSESIEDHVSMAPFAARKAQKIIRNVEYVIAIEFLCAAQGIDFRRDGLEMGNGEKIKTKPLEPSNKIRKTCEILRKQVKKLKEDRIMYKDIKKAVELIRNGDFCEAIQLKNFASFDT